MSSLTLTIDEELLRRARIRALELGTSVNALVREWLEGFAEADDEFRATEDFISLARRSQASSGHAGRTWTRDQLYDDRLSRYAE